MCKNMLKTHKKVIFIRVGLDWRHDSHRKGGGCKDPIGWSAAFGWPALCLCLVELWIEFEFVPFVVMREQKFHLMTAPPRLAPMTPAFILTFLLHASCNCKDVMIQCILYAAQCMPYLWCLESTIHTLGINKMGFNEIFAALSVTEDKLMNFFYLQTNMCIKNLNKWDPWCKQTLSMFVLL